MELSTDKTILTAKQIEEFILHQDKNFVPAIASKVDVAAYACKVLKRASFAFAHSEGELAGMVIFYCNDMTNRQAYISYFAIDDLYRRMGLGRNLLATCITLCKAASMNLIKVETWAANTAGIHLYTSLGFRVTELVDDRPGDKTARLILEM